MADMAQLVIKVRTAVSDNPALEADRRYPDEFYEEAITAAVHRINCDTGTSYAVVDVPAGMEYVVVWLATANVALIMATIESSGLSEGDVQRVRVPGLEVEYDKSNTNVSASWDTIFKRLEALYLGWLDSCGRTAASIASSLPLVTQTSLGVASTRRGGARFNRTTDKGILVAPVASLVFTAKGRKIIWSATYDWQFAKYVIRRRALPQDWDDAACIASIGNNTKVSFLDAEGVAAGNYQYAVYTVSKNGIETMSNQIAFLVE